MSESRGIKKHIQEKLEGKRVKGNPRKKWMDNISNDLEKLGMTN